MKKIIHFFVRNHLLTNFIFISVLLLGIFFWQKTNKEEFPYIEFDFVRVSINYSGASPEDIEHFITKPIENSIKGIDGIHSIRSTSSSGNSSIFVELNSQLENQQEIVNDLRNNILNVKLPDKTQTPNIKQFKTSQRAIIDVALINQDIHLLDLKSRREMQKYALALESQLLALSSVNQISKNGYLQEEIRVNLIPKKLIDYDFSIDTIISKLNSYNLRQPIGQLENKEESEIFISSANYDTKKLKNFTLRGSYQQPEVKLGDLAEITHSFVKNKSITKVNGKEAIILQVTKNSSVGIIKAIDQIKKTLNSFKANNLKNSPVKIVSLDDESLDIRNRLQLISYNGLIGFALILIILFLFLDFRSGFWVAMGIPFIFCFTMIVVYYLGFTINNITLAGVIIVMGMVVDDAIVVAENINRMKNNGIPLNQAVVEGTLKMFLPITAGVITTCVAFFPLFQIENRFAQMVVYIPAIVIIMLMASLLESLFILPGHMKLSIPWNRKSKRSEKLEKIQKSETPFPSQLQMTPDIYKNVESNFNTSTPKKIWFNKVENFYSHFLQKQFRYRYLILIIFILLIGGSIYHLTTNMKFVMFPNEETTQILITATTPEGTKRKKTALASQKIEKILGTYLDQEIIGYRTTIGLSRWGRTATENSIRIIVELLPLEKRTQTLSELIEVWEKKFAQLKEIEIKIIKNRFGRSLGGSPIEIVVLDNDEEIRQKVVKKIFNTMKKDPNLFDVEIEKTLTKKGFELDIRKNLAEQLGIDKKNIVSTLRTILTGNIIEEIPKGDETVNFTVTLPQQNKTNLSQILQIPISGKSDLKFPLKEFFVVKETIIPNSIVRESYKRISKIYASHEKKKKTKFKKSKSESTTNQIRKNSKKEKNQSSENSSQKSPLEIAQYYETKVFPNIIAEYPTATIYFDGEVKESRESQNQLRTGIIITIILIYMILALLFQSLSKPFLIMSVIPFGIVGVILAYYLHGISFYGFFTMLGLLGLSGVVINDAIVMLVKLEEEKKRAILTDSITSVNLKTLIAETAKTRVKAVLITTLTTVTGMLPSVYGISGYDPLLSEMMFTMTWGLVFSTCITLILLPILYYFFAKLDFFLSEKIQKKIF